MVIGDVMIIISFVSFFTFDSVENGKLIGFEPNFKKLILQA
jgi:hypothetical protein